MEITIIWSWFSFFSGIVAAFLAFVVFGVGYGLRQRSKAAKWSKAAWESTLPKGAPKK